MDFEFKVYLKDGRECFEYREKGRKATKKDFELTRNLLNLVYLDIWAYSDLTSEMGKLLLQIYQRNDDLENHINEFRKRLSELAKAHIYFELLQLDWNKRLDDFLKREKGGSDLLPRKKITQLPSNIDTMQKQIKHLFAEVLDVTVADKELTVQQRMVGYYQKNISSLDRFTFQPKSTNFELVNDNTFTDVLYPKDIYDLIDFFLSESIKREISMKVCKSCGRYFAVTGYANTEYCDREFQNSGKTCKEVGAVRLLQNKLSTDPVHKAYSRAYKTHFARIKYRKTTKEEFTIWSEMARAMRDKTLAGEMSLADFEHWLKG